jgi:glutamate dehydrogenase (NAD(P)+)
VVAASDSRGTIADAHGLDLDALDALKREGKSVAELEGAKASDRDAIVGIPCDIWIPAARPDVIRADNVDRLDAKLVLQGANIPVTAEAERALHERGVLSVPDFIANAGGVICAAVEYAGGTQTAAFHVIDEKLRYNMREVLERARETGVSPREAAEAMAEQRVRKAMTYRRSM